MYQSKDKVNRMPVLMTLTDGTEMSVALRLTLSNKLMDALSTSDLFLDILTEDGEQQFISKSAIRFIRGTEGARQTQQEAAPRPINPGPLDPYSVLKLQRNASPDDVKKAYHKMVRLYHPDRIASFDLPEDMKEYARDMLVRVNLAFEELKR